MTTANPFADLKKKVRREKNIISQISSLTEQLLKTDNTKEEQNIRSQITSLKGIMKIENDDVLKIVNDLSLVKPLPQNTNQNKKSKRNKKDKGFKVDELEMETIRRLWKKKAKEEKKKSREKSNSYVGMSQKFFSKLTDSAENAEVFKLMKKDIFKSNISYSPKSYISMIFFTMTIALTICIFITSFFLFFNISPLLPIIIPTGEPISSRIFKVFWIPFLVPFLVFLGMLLYPSAERKSIEKKINTELPFATIHMSAISGSSVEPSKIFTILVSTNEYPALQREFTKLINEVNIHGYNLVTALRNSSFRSPSRKLSELYNGLATTITSGGNLSNFFDQRAQTLLLDYKLEKDKETKANETFMDIYISIVIAAPMVFMLLLIMIQISGLGISFSSSLITLIMVVVVGVINFIFLTVLHLRKPSEK